MVLITSIVPVEQLVYLSVLLFVRVGAVVVILALIDVELNMEFNATVSYHVIYINIYNLIFNLDNTGSCVQGSARLVNGTIIQEGRIEVCSNGIWSMVCQNNWNAIDAYILCKQLGYVGTGIIVFLIHVVLSLLYV